ncbi:unnamed protein product [Orchesella dallaii]
MVVAAVVGIPAPAPNPQLLTYGYGLGSAYGSYGYPAYGGAVVYG